MKWSRIIQLAVLIGLAAMSFGLESGQYKLDVLRRDSAMNMATSNSYIKYSYLASTLSPMNSVNQFLKKYMIFDQFDVPDFSQGAPYIVSYNVTPNIIIPGDYVTVDIQVSEVLRNWSVLVDDVNQQNSIYDDSKHVIFQYQAMNSRTKLFDMNVTLVDMFYNVGQWSAPFMLYVLNGEDNLVQQLVTPEVLNEVHQGMKNAKNFVFDLSVVQFDSMWTSLSVNISVDPMQSPFDAVRIIEAYTNTTLSETASILYNQPMDLFINTANTLVVTPNKYYLAFDLKDTAPIGLTFNIAISQLTTRLKTGSPMPAQTTGSMGTGVITVVEKDRPIVLQGGVDDYVSETKTLTVNIEHEIIVGTVDKISYRVHDITSSNMYPPVLMPYTSTPLSENNRFEMINNRLNNLALTHNHQYEVIFELVGPKNSIPLSTTNVFLVDTTPPPKPGSLKIQTFALSNSESKTKANLISQTGVRFMADTPQGYDPESGLKAYRILRKSNIQPDWQAISSGNVSTADTLILNYREDNNALYYYEIQLQNRAKLWSDPSDPKELDLRLSGALIDTLFNSPNPFDNRRQNTTIYYTLREDSDVELYLYDMFGYLIRKWNFSAGNTNAQKSNTLEWDGTNAFGDKVSKGAYILIIKATDHTGTSMQKKYAIGVIR